MQFLKQFFVFLILIALIAFADYLYVGTGAIGIDDGNIFLNYAHHIAHGDGFVFNTNGERVEGFTSLLWVLICAAFYLISSNPEILLICFCCLLTALSVTIVYRNLKNDIENIYSKFSKYFFWIYCAFIVCIGASYVAWSVLSLMENALWNFFFTSTVLLVANTIKPVNVSFKKEFILVVSGCLLVITRPEALAWNLVFTVILLWTFIQHKRKIFFPLIYFVCIASTSVALTLFRLHYFGFEFPNTYYAKISPDKIYNLTEGFKYALSFLTGYQALISFLFVLMAIVLLYAVFRLKILSKKHREAISDNVIITKLCIITLIILIGFVLPFTTGGDHFGGFRFYQDLLLLFAFGIVVIVWMFRHYPSNETAVKFLSLTVIILFFCVIGLNDLFNLKDPSKAQLNYEFALAQDGRDMAEDFNDMLPAAKPSIGVIAAGGFGLKYLGNTVDLMGLNNTLMGHSPGDRKGIKNHAAFNKDVFYKLNPDVILPSYVKDSNEANIQYFNMLNLNNFDNEAMKNIFNDARFQQAYEPYFIAHKNDSAGMFIFVNKHYISLLPKDKNVLIKKIK